MRYADDRLQLLISRTLRGGVLAAATLGIVGCVLFFAARPGGTDFHQFHGATHPFTQPGAIVRQAFGTPGEALELRALSVAQCGVILLLMTPVIRVLFSILGFAAERDSLYVGITCIVLTALGFSICLH